MNGLVLARRGWNVTLSDVPEMINALTLNVKHNCPDAIVTQLMWGDMAACASLGVFDLVVGSDVVYKRVFIAPLVETLWATVKRDAYICCEQREEGVLDEFVCTAKTKGFAVKRIKRLPLPDMDHLCLFHLKRPGGANVKSTSVQ